MSTDYDLYCTVCKKSVKCIASSSIAYGDKMWRGPGLLDEIEKFLFEHRAHSLLFEDSDAFDADDEIAE
ncbi:hypothetical protein ABH944_004812 [Caballeronia udeis]|uniref:Uncharacterized protein n=1 Tax=Caballeronia udeis TaxID=1232866 RepID=A0ABW8MLX1_9BURK